MPGRPDHITFPHRAYSTTCVAYTSERALLVGGSHTNAVLAPEVMIYDHRLRTFTEIGALDEGLKSVPCVLDGREVVFCTNGVARWKKVAKATYIFDIATETWERKNEWDLPASAVGYQRLYVAGGRVIISQGFEFDEAEVHAGTNSHWHPRSMVATGLGVGWGVKFIQT